MALQVNLRIAARGRKEPSAAEAGGGAGLGTRAGPVPATAALEIAVDPEQSKTRRRRVQGRSAKPNRWWQGPEHFTDASDSRAKTEQKARAAREGQAALEAKQHQQ